MRMVALNAELETSKGSKRQIEDVALNAKLINGGSERHNGKYMEALNEKQKKNGGSEHQTEER